MHKRWGKCWGGMSCFGTQKGGTRVVPASSRMPDGNNAHQAANGTQGRAAAAAAVVGLLAANNHNHNNNHHQAATALLAPPSSPASFSNSALTSTAHSPNCFLSLSANSPGGPSSSMFATGPYANETQLVSPPVFSTFTTEPSTAPFTPPPELAHITTPSSPDVPFAHFLSSKNNSKVSEGKRGGDLQASYSLYPASSPISPVSRAASGGGGDCLSEAESIPDSKQRHHHHPRSDTTFGLDTESITSKEPNFFCPETFAQFYLDNPHTGGRLSVSKESSSSDVYGNGHHQQNRQSKQQDVEEPEAYRASFGFSADEIITTAQYVEISDVSEESFTMRPFAAEETALLTDEETRNSRHQAPESGTAACGRKSKGRVLTSDEEEGLSKMLRSNSYSNRKSRKYGLSNSDAEIEYGRRARRGIA